MKPAVIGPTLVLTGALVLTATAFANGPQGHERSAPPPAPAPREAAVPRSAPPPPPPPPPPPAPVRVAPTVAPHDSGNRPMPRTFSTPREGGVYERGGVRGADTGGRPPSIIRTEPVSGSSPAPTVGGVSTVRGPEAIDSPVFAAQRARTRSAGQPSTSSGSPARATPRGDRPRDNRSAIGTAAPRTHPPYNGDHNHGHGGYGYYGHPYHYPNYWWGYAGFGLGYFYYDPYWWGYPPYYGPAYGGAYGYGTGGAYGSPDPGYGAPDPGNGAPDPGYGSSDPAAYGVGQLKLKVSPRDAQVYVDGYFTGLVDDYDGFFQRLTIDSGSHRIEIRKPGFVTLSFDVRIPPDETVTYRGELQPQQP